MRLWKQTRLSCPVSPSSRSHTWKPLMARSHQAELEGGRNLSGTERIWNFNVCVKLVFSFFPSLHWQRQLCEIDTSLYLLLILLNNPYFALINFNLKLHMCARASFSLLLVLPGSDGATRVNIYSNLLSIRLQSIWVHPFRELLCAAQSVQYSDQIF